MKNQETTESFRRLADIDESSEFRFCKTICREGILLYRPANPITLKSGRMSRFYINDRGAVTMNSLVTRCIGEALRSAVRCINALDQMKSELRLIGVPVAGIGLAVAVIVEQENCRARLKEIIIHRGPVEDVVEQMDKELRPKIGYCLLREGQKTHGAQRKRWVVEVEPDQNVARYFLLDNVLTSGGSIIEAAQKLREDGYDTQQVHSLVLVDRSVPGALEEIRQKADLASLRALFSLDELIRMSVEEELLPEAALADWNREQQETSNVL